MIISTIKQGEFNSSFDKVWTVIHDMLKDREEDILIDNKGEV
jgi:hypothetical protein